MTKLVPTPGANSAAPPDWKKLRAITEYEDKKIVSRITNKLLTPTAYSPL